MAQIKFILNGAPVTWEGVGAARLQTVLRQQFGLTSVKCGCGVGECGACAVLIDGLLRNSCLVALGAVEGCTVLTLEGYRDTARFAVLEQALAAQSAVQCGFCTPGMVLAAEALLAANPHPSEAEIRRALSGNLCRCTGYRALVEAVAAAAKAGEGLW